MALVKEYSIKDKIHNQGVYRIDPTIYRIGVIVLGDNNSASDDIKDYLSMNYKYVILDVTSAQYTNPTMIPSRDLLVNPKPTEISRSPLPPFPLPIIPDVAKLLTIMDHQSLRSSIIKLNSIIKNGNLNTIINNLLVLIKTLIQQFYTPATNPFGINPWKS